MKRIFTLSLTLILFSLSLAPCAGARASDQIANGWATAYVYSDHKIGIEYQVIGTGIMSMLGANCVKLYEKNGNSWKLADTKNQTDFLPLFTTNLQSYCYEVFFSVDSGKQYYAEVYAFATNKDGTDSRIYSSNVVTVH